MANIIARVDVKGKLLDIRDKLSLASFENYAAILGQGGGKGSYVACFGLYLCDYSKGTGNSSVTVSCNISPDLAEILCATAKNCIVNPMPSAGTLMEIGAAQAKANELLGSARSLLKKGTLSEDKKQITVPYDNLVALGKEISAYCDALTKTSGNAGSDDATHQWTQDKLDIYKEDNGYAPVTRLTIKRQKGRDLAWYIAITQGVGKVNKKENGSCYFTDFKKTSTAFINIDDMQMYSLMSAALRTLQVYQLTYGAQLYKNGKTAEAKAKREANEGQKGAEENGR